MNKNSFVVLGFLSFVSFAIASSNSTLTGSGAISLKVEAPEKRIFVVYPGKLSNQCGIRLVLLDKYGVITEDIIGKIQVKSLGGTLTPKPGNSMIIYDFSKEVLANQFYGIEVWISTKDGQDLSSLSPQGSELLVVSSPCSIK